MTGPGPIIDRWLLRPLAWLGAALVFAMMALTFVDVVGRYVFNAPVRGSTEATELMLAVIVFAGLPLAAAAREHIRIDILEQVLSERAKRRQAVFGFSFAALVTAFVAWRLALRAAELGRLGDLSSHLGFPLAWLAWFLATACAVTVLVFAGLAWRAARS
ncbi:MAG TPA: TRAP transporter small permease [Burkholderiales bacterium]|nr:TRAP transporter small permease [Burkholderiales bacterium]